MTPAQFRTLLNRQPRRPEGPAAFLARAGAGALPEGICWYDFPEGAARPRIRILYAPASVTDRAPEDAGRRPDAGCAGRHAPQHVKDAAAAAQDALRVFAQHRFRAPLTDGGPLLIELANIRPFRGYTSPGENLIVVERALRGAEQAETIAHEIFHRVQYAYNATSYSAEPQPDGDEEVMRFLPMLREGGARLAEIMVVARSQRYEHDAQDWFLGTGQSLARVQRGRRRGFVGSSYQAGLFWKYVAEQHGPAPRNGVPIRGAREAETQRILLEQTLGGPAEPNPPVTIETLRRAHLAMRAIGDLDRFGYLPGLTDVPLRTETSWGNFQVALALNGSAGADGRFRFEEAHLWRGVTAGRHVVPESRSVRFDELASEIPDETPVLRAAPLVQRLTVGDAPAARFGRGDFGPEMIFAERIEEEITDARLQLGRVFGEGGPDPADQPGMAPLPPRMLYAFAMMAFRVAMPGGAITRLLRVRWTPSAELTDALVQVISLDEAGELQDLYRHDGALSRGADAAGRPLDRVFALRQTREVIILVGSRTNGGNFRLQLSQAADQPVLMAGTCNGRSGRFLTQDPNRAAFDWLSPDLALFPGNGPYRHILEALILNRGTLTAKGLKVTCRYARLDALPLPLSAWSTAELREGAPGELVTEDECTRIEARTPAWMNHPRVPVPAPCFFRFDEVLSTPQSDLNPGVFSFGIRPDTTGGRRDAIEELVVRIEATAEGAEAVPLIFHAVFNGRGPRLVPL